MKKISLCFLAVALAIGMQSGAHAKTIQDEANADIVKKKATATATAELQKMEIDTLAAGIGIDATIMAKARGQQTVTAMQAQDGMAVAGLMLHNANAIRAGDINDNAYAKLESAATTGRTSDAYERRAGVNSAHTIAFIATRNSSSPASAANLVPVPLL